MLEFIFEIIFEIIFEGSAMLLSGKKVPMFIRVIAFLVVAGLYLGGIGLFMFIGYSALTEQDYVPACICFTVVMLILVAGFCQIRKELIKRKGEKQS